ncbi:MAG: ribosomal protein S18-alanine N-acetyltransferase [Firmicutes bacterium]|nr:ribosomal protein S18-alanine N-acetyltransferase [Bacillota bacterium]
MEGLIVIRPLGADDLEAVLQIQAQCPEIVAWSRAAYAPVVCGNYRGWVAVTGPQVLGFLVSRQTLEEAEILNLAVRPEARRLGLGSQLLARALEEARRAGVRRVGLEVRASNVAAIRFYERHGFRLQGRRRDYYSNPREDALLYGCVLAPSQPET